MEVYMRLGKLDNDTLERLILSKFKKRRPEVLSMPGIGEDCAAVDLGSNLAVLSMDPITSAAKDLGRLSVYINCNDAASAGAEPVGIMVTLLIPPGASEDDISNFANQLCEAADHANVDILGGHTEVTDSVARMITCTAVLAKVPKNGLILPSGMREGDDIIMTKWAGMEGTAVIASDFSHLAELERDELEFAAAFKEQISAVREGLEAAGHGAHAMHDVTEGGVLGAAWELAYASGCGIELDLASVPVHPVTEKICLKLGLDPYRLLSSGCMLIACKDGENMVRVLNDCGVKAQIIGKACGKGVRLKNGPAVEPPQADEIYKLFGSGSV
ncbi:MAG: Hydrogenase expression/formation protein HypE [Firmicutes bacterium ADurb.Bin182]|nr:MAG: Hydrogenase expression/formation protein HypE [Firmicutes bacterium ADurb.Bin182]